MRRLLESRWDGKSFNRGGDCPWDSLGKISKNDSTLSRLIRGKREKILITKIINEEGGITTDSTDTTRIIRDNYKQTYT